jgi:hypothetical protein
MQLPKEPTIPTRVTLETMSGDGWQPHEATIANLTRTEVWIRIEETPEEFVNPGSPVRLVLSSPDGGVRTAETRVLWRIGVDVLLLILMRPTLWDPPSRRAHSRARVAIPASLRLDGGAPPLSARTTNVGVGGFFCVAGGPVAAGSQFPVSLWLSPAESFDCLAEVVRVEDDPDDATGRQAVLAFRFLDLTLDDQARLASALVALADDVDENDVPLAWRSTEAATRP